MPTFNPAGGEKNVEVVIVSGDDEEDGFNETMGGLPFIAVPFKDIGKRKPDIEKKIPCHFYPQPCVLDAKSGKILFGSSSSEAEALHGEISSCSDAARFLAKYVAMCAK